MTFAYDRSKYGRCCVCGAPNDHPSYSDDQAHIHPGHPRSVFGATPVNSATNVAYVKTDEEAREANQLCLRERPDTTAIPEVKR